MNPIDDLEMNTRQPQQPSPQGTTDLPRPSPSSTQDDFRPYNEDEDRVDVDARLWAPLEGARHLEFGRNTGHGLPPLPSRTPSPRTSTGRRPSNTATEYEEQPMLLNPDPVAGPSHVQSNDAPQSDDAEKVTRRSTTREHTRGAFERLGLQAKIVWISCPIIATAALSFISWLWHSDRQEDKHWKTLMGSEWGPRIVTITAVILRTVLSFLAGITTAILASLGIEGSGGALEDAPLLSIARFIGPSPDFLWKEVLLGKVFVPWALRAHIGLLIVTTVMVQFTSTLLLWDFGLDKVLDFPQDKHWPSGYSWETSNNATTWSPLFEGPRHYWTREISALYPFAEYANESSIVQDEGLDDTGSTLRAFLPVSDDEILQNLEYFEGTASLFDTRIMCFRPTLKNYSRIEHASTDVEFDHVDLLLEIPDLDVGPAQLVRHTSPFRVNVTRGSTVGSRQWSILQLSPSIGGMLSPLNPMSLGENTFWYGYDKWRVSGQTTDCDQGIGIGNAYLVVKETGVSWDGMKEVKDDQANEWWAKLSSESDAKNDPGILEMTMCLDFLNHESFSQQVQDWEIVAKGGGSQQKTRLQHNRETESYDVRTIQQQLGGAGRHAGSWSQRNILNLTSPVTVESKLEELLKQHKCAEFGESAYDAATYSWVTQQLHRSWLPNPNFTDIRREVLLTPGAAIAQNYSRSPLPVRLCTGLGCRPSNWEHANHIRASDSLAQVFESTMNDTESPALALQSVMTLLLREIYYDWQPKLNAETDVRVVMMKTVQMPMGYRGFATVVGISVLHMVLCGLALVAFCLRTSFSCLHNGWQVVADVIRDEDASKVLENVGRSNDAEVKQWIEGNGKTLLRRPFRLRRAEHEEVERSA